MVEIIPNAKILGWQTATFVAGMLLLWFPGFKYLGRILQTRRTQIQRDLEQASSAKQEMEKVKVDFESQVAALRIKSQQRLDEALKEASRERDRLVEAAKVEAKKLVEEAKQEIGHERERVVRSVRDEAVTLAILAAERVLQEKVDTEANRKLVNTFIQDMKQSH
jgi:F-type H+-transporting ATPase subunit b